jgi:hypothetical protein
MSDTTDVAQPGDDSVAEKATGARRQSSRLHQTLAWVGIIAGGLFVIASIFLSGFFLSWSEHTAMGHMEMGHMGMGQESKDCCGDMKPGDHMMKPGEHMKPGAMTGSGR